MTFDESASLVGALLASLALVTILYEHLLPFSGTLGFLVCWFARVPGLLRRAVVAMSNPRPVVVDHVVTATLWAAAGVVLLAIGSTLVLHRAPWLVRRSCTRTSTRRRWRVSRPPRR